MTYKEMPDDGVDAPHGLPSETPPDERIGSIPGFVIPWLFLFLGTLAAFGPTIFSLFSRMQTDPGDTRFNNYVLEHGYRWVIGDALHRSFWDPPFFWPAENVAAYSDILLGAAPPYWLLRFVDIAPDTAFQLWMILCLWLNYLVMYILLRRSLHLSILAATGGAYLFAFANMRVAQLGHQQLLPQFYSVSALLFLIESFRHLRIRPWWSGIAVAGFFASVVLQIYSGFYLGWFFVFGGVVYGVTALLNRRTRCDILKFIEEHPWTVSICSILSILSLSWMGCHYYYASMGVGTRPWSKVISMVPRIESWLYMGIDNLLLGWFYRYVATPKLPMIHEHAIGMGAVALCVGMYGVWKNRNNPWVCVLFFGSLFVFLWAMLYAYEFTPWKYVWQYFPGGSAIRAVSRICLLLLIPLSIEVGLGLNAVRKSTLALALLLLICVEQIHITPHFDKLKIREDTAKIAASVDRDCEAFYYLKAVPTGVNPEPAWRYQLDAMWAQMALGKPTVNGYSGNVPPGWDLKNNVVRSKAELSHIQRMLASWAEMNGTNLKGICITQSGNPEKLPKNLPDPDPGAGENR